MAHPSPLAGRLVVWIAVILIHGAGLFVLGRAVQPARPDLDVTVMMVDLVPPSLHGAAATAATAAPEPDPERRPNRIPRPAARSTSRPAPAAEARTSPTPMPSPFRAATVPVETMTHTIAETGAGVEGSAVPVARSGGGSGAATRVAGQPGAGAAQQGSGDSVAPPGHPDAYAAAVLAWIERHKRYPAGATARRLEGTVIVSMTLDRRGRLTAIRLVRSSGEGVLDQAALDQMHAAQPFPSAPAGADWSRRRFEASLDYRLRRPEA